MCGKIFSAIILLIALVMAVLAVVLPPEHLEALFIADKFFSVMIPVLAVGALIKFICRCQKCATTCTCCKTSDNKMGGCH